MDFPEWNVWISNKISLNFVPRGLIDNNTALDQMMARHRTGDKPLSEPRLVTHICFTRPRWVKEILQGDVSVLWWYCNIIIKHWWDMRENISIYSFSCCAYFVACMPHWNKSIANIKMAFKTAKTILWNAWKSLLWRHMTAWCLKSPLNWLFGRQGSIKRKYQRAILLAFCEGNPLANCGIRTQRASDPDSFSVSWSHPVMTHTNT